MSQEDPDSDEALMLRYQAGDAAAFDQLYARHRGGLFRFMLRQCRSRERHWRSMKRNSPPRWRA